MALDFAALMFVWLAGFLMGIGAACTWRELR